ncbi:MAG TPA: hypothetical protein EYG05_06125 [Candidatus Thioglobus autotrophicus]|nr:hypothetical protein [Candidatus Thioglobus autotrophicus]
MQIYKYLNKIKFGERLNFESFRKQLLKQGFDDKTVFKIFETKRTSRSSYLVKVLDQELFAQLLIDFPEHIIKDRVSASNAGDSHRHRVSQAMIILWSAQSNHPIVVLNNADKINSPVTLSKRLLIIENQENFIQKKRTLRFLQQQFSDFNDDNLDIAHGSGNAISNRLNKTFFNHYQQIDCLLDLDMGGLEIFKNLINLTQHPNLNFLLPPCADTLLKQSKIQLQEDHLINLRQYHKEYSVLRPAIELISKHKKMLEQELYL